MPPIDPSNLSRWYAAHAPALTLYARQFSPDPAAAEDAVHEAFVQLLAQPRPPDNVRAWLFKSVRNAALTTRRSSTRRGRRERTVGQTRPEWFLPRPEDVIDAAAAQRALATLPPDQREIVILRIWGQASFPDIADVTGKSLSTVYDHYKTALATLKRKMESPCPTTRPPTP